jgi:very-short-patch-repair endonuclease
MYNSTEINLATTIFNMVGGKSIQLYTKKHPILISELVKSTTFLLCSANNIERAYCVLHNISEKTTCKDCDNVVKWDISKREYKPYCSRKCSSASAHRKEKVKQTLQDRYGVTNASNISGVQQKKIDTCCKNHGVDFPQQKSTIRDKTFKTMQHKFGVDYPYQNELINKQRKETLFNNYGVHNPSQNLNIQNKKIETNFAKFGQKHFNTVEIAHAVEYLENKEWMYDQHYTQQKSLLQISNELNCCDGTVGRYLRSHELETQHFFQSTGEREVSEFINSVNIKTINNTRNIISPYELDIYLPEHNLAIEYNGLYWHSEQQGKDRNYHKKKHDLCKEQGIQLITIFEDEWQQKQEQVKNKIISLLNKDNRKIIYARKTNIINVTTKNKSCFFEHNHIQGNGPGSINIGLDYEGTLVACMSFIK